MKRWPFADSKNISWGLLFILCFLMGMVFSYTPYGTGDKTEYIMTTESLLYDRDLVYTPDVDLKRHIAFKPATVEYSPDQIHLLQNTRDGKVRFGSHSYYYPLLIAPFYAVFSAIGHYYAYYSFYFINAVLYFASLVMGFLFLKEKNNETVSFVASSAFFIFSAAMTFVLWIHSEIFIVFLVTAFLFFWKRERYFTASMIIGIAAGVKLPLLAYLLPMWFDLYGKKEYRRALIGFGISILFMLPQYYYNVAYLGAFNPLVKEGYASIRFITMSTVIGSIFDPFYGLIWFYPLVVFSLVNMERTWTNILLLVSGLLILIGMNGTAHIHSHQVGLRYLTFVYPLFLFLPGKIQWNLANKMLFAFSLIISAGLVINPINNSRAPAPTRPEYFTYLPYKISHSLLKIQDNPEIEYFTHNGISDNIKVIHGDIAEDSWLPGGTWVRVLVNAASEGEIRLKVRGWDKNTAQKVIVRLNDKNEFTYLIASKEVSEITIPLSKIDIYSYSQRHVNHIVYLDLYAEPWIPREVNNGDDSRILGAKILAVFNNDKILYQRDVNIVARSQLSGNTKLLQGNVSPDKWITGGSPIKLLVSEVSPGVVGMKLGSWNRRLPQKVLITINKKKNYVYALDPGKATEISFPVSADDIRKVDPLNADMRNVINLDILAEAWVPKEAISGSEDNRILSVMLLELKNNKKIFVSR